eukprot:snap_masked-scaffold617_size123379-processed-gene-0.6 protein:Tk03719 transcript:snap_masked-scaffold617_size123379-processed-gene-0.6-mRNA-1 annotation:"hypothetical protein AaeL_AAEL007147"
MAHRPPSGCTQYFTGASGTISSYNHAGGQMLQAQMYTNCIRQELGYCQTLFKERTGTTPDPFELGNAVAGGGTSSTQSGEGFLVGDLVHLDLSTHDDQSQSRLLGIGVSLGSICPTEWFPGPELTGLKFAL